MSKLEDLGTTKKFLKKKENALDQKKNPLELRGLNLKKGKKLNREKTGLLKKKEAKLKAQQEKVKRFLELS